MINLITENKLTLKGVNQMVAHVEEHEKFEFDWVTSTENLPPTSNIWHTSLKPFFGL